MENTTLSSQEELIQEAKNCLKENDDEIDSIVDAGRGDYRTARISVLMRHMKMSNAQAKGLLEQLDSETRESIRRIQEVKKVTDNIQKDPYSMLVDQLAFKYECFCREHGLDTNAPIPENLKSITIFEFSPVRGEKQGVSLGIAHFLMNPGRRAICRDFFVSAAMAATIKSLN
ncbi:MAG: hypothetical protein PHH16_00795 [Candidatus Gracilibacteria bacterium]|nr:hypothetical protein [Candidatus Gracilibacteria bacterium]